MYGLAKEYGFNGLFQGHWCRRSAARFRAQWRLLTTLIPMWRSCPITFRTELIPGGYKSPFCSGTNNRRFHLSSVGKSQFLRRGVISNNTPLDTDGRVVYVETTASFGSSGSPAFLGNGRPIGIVTSSVTLPGGLPLPAGVAGVIPGEKVNKILRDAGVLSAAQASLTPVRGRGIRGQ